MCRWKKNYDRYKVSAILVNKSGKNNSVRLANATDSEVIELDCINATGAKLTSKKQNLKMKPQNVNVTYWHILKMESTKVL